jgi:hypothetical protein
MRRFRFIVVLAVLFWVSRHLDVSLPVTHWLGDQVDQFQSALALLSGHMNYLYGPYMSGTNPPVHTIGPMGAIIFSGPMLFGQMPDVGHIWLGLILWGALAFFLTAIWEQMGVIASVFAGLILLSTRGFWWAENLYWAAILPLFWSLIHVGFFVMTVPRWRAVFIWPHLAMLGIGLHFHAVYLVMLPLFLFALLLNRGYWRRSFVALRREHAPKVALALAFGPFLLAEVWFKFRDTRAISAHFRQKAATSYSEGWLGFDRVAEYFQGELWKVFGFSQLEARWRPGIWVVLGVISVIGLIRLARSRDKPWTKVMVLLGPSAILWHALFFLKMNRPIQGDHYLVMGLPLFTVWVVCVFYELAKASKIISGIAVVMISFRLWTVEIPDVSHTVEHTPWTWAATKSALTAACAWYGSAGLSTNEGPGFLTYTPDLDPVLRFTLKRWNFGCAYSPNAPVTLRPDISGALSAVWTNEGRAWDLVETYAPGIGVYRLRPE